MLRSFAELPEISISAPLGDWMSIIVPEATTNLVTNPSIERATTGYTANNGAIIARNFDLQRRGAAALGVTTTTHINSGVYYSLTLTANTTYTFSVDVIHSNTNQAMRIAIADNTGAILNRYEFTGVPFWQRVWVSATVPSTGTYRLYVEKNGGAIAGGFYIDGLQCEAKAYPTTYCDGDQKGFVPTRVDYLWSGTPHASQSTRGAQCRAGGRVMNLSSYGFTLMAILGLGMAPAANIAQPAGFTGGSYYQRTIPTNRDFSLLGDMRQASLLNLQNDQSDLIDALKYNVTNPPQPLILRYQPEGCFGRREREGDVFEVVCVHNGPGPGNTLQNEVQETVELRFTQYLPLIFSEGERGDLLSHQETVSSPGFIIQRDADGDWTELGNGANTSGVLALAVGQDGSIYAAGSFTSMDGVANTSRIARWDPTTGAWTALGTGANGQVNALAIGPDGTLYAGGVFAAMGGVANTARIAKWDGSVWTAMGTGGAGGDVNAIAVGPDGSVYAGGSFTSMGGVANTLRLARWDGSAWNAMSTGADNDVHAIVAKSGTSIYIGGTFANIGGVAAAGIAKWDGTVFTALGSGAVGGIVFALDIGPDGSLYAGGGFTSMGGVANTRGIARWNGVGWVALATGFSSGGVVRALDVLRSGDVLMGGLLQTAGGVSLPDGMTRWNGSVFVPLDIDLSGSATVRSVAESPDGSLTFGWQSTAGDATASDVTAVLNGGTADTWPIVEFVGPGRVYQIRNETTDKTIYFDLTLNAGERATLDLDPSNPTFTSTFRGDISKTILPGSQEGSFYLQGTNNVFSGENRISLFIAGTTTSATQATMRWRERYHAIQTARQR